MELFVQSLIGSAISSFVILLIFAGISPFEILLQSISSINFYDLISTNEFRFKIKGISILSLIIWILVWLLKMVVNRAGHELAANSQ